MNTLTPKRGQHSKVALFQTLRRRQTLEKLKFQWQLECFKHSSGSSSRHHKYLPKTFHKFLALSDVNCRSKPVPRSKSTGVESVLRMINHNLTCRLGPKHCSLQRRAVKVSAVPASWDIATELRPQQSHCETPCDRRASLSNRPEFGWFSELSSL